MKYVLGVDGGNTKTIAIVAAADGTVLGAGRAGCGALSKTVSPTTVVENISEAVMIAARTARISTDQFAFAALSLAGADWPEDFELLNSAFHKTRLVKRFTVVNDAIGGIYAGTPDGVGISIVVGTAAAIGARSIDGRSWFCGYWCHNDSTDELASRVVEAVYKSELQLVPFTTLARRVCNIMGKETVDEVLHALTRRDHPERLPAGLVADALYGEAENGDDVAASIVRKYAEMLGDYAVTAARRVGFAADERVPVVLAGGQLKHHSVILKKAIIDRVAMTLQRIDPISAFREPVVGAVSLALSGSGVSVTEPMLDAIQDSLPSDSFFATL